MARWKEAGTCDGLTKADAALCGHLEDTHNLHSPALRTTRCANQRHSQQDQGHTIR